MKRLYLTIFLILAAAGNLTAQTDPYGVKDTVSIENLTVVPGREFTVHVNLWNDEELGALSLPLIYPKEMLEFQEISFDGGRVAYVNNKPVSIDTVNGTILVGVIIIFEAYLPAGKGSLFTLKFRMKDTVTPGQIAILDSTFVRPAAHLVLSYKTGANIFPCFRRGEITVASQNRPPGIAAIPELYVAEGDSLHIDLHATDPEGDPVTIANPIHPYSSRFTDHGDGAARFDWRPDFVGPLSADQSPFYFVFWASDGNSSSSLKVKVNVINVNRSPLIQAPSALQSEAGDSVGIPVTAIDPDFDPITWQISGLPSEAAFDFNNPGLIYWLSAFADSGQYHIRLIATDQFGLADTADIALTMKPVTLFGLRLDTLTAFSGNVVTFNVAMKNRFAIKEFKLLVNLDPTVLTVLAVSLEGTRAEQFDYLDYRVNYNGVQGDLRVTGRTGYADAIPAGDGPVCRITVQVSSDLNYVGNQVPLRFVNHVVADNSLIMDGGQTVLSTTINFFPGYILIGTSGTKLLGDINLNGVAFEISDAVYFTNFFISPGLYPIDGQRLINSDINEDGFAPSVADLVLLIKIVVGQEPRPAGKPLPGTAPEAKVELTRAADGLYLVVDAPVEVGGLYFELAGDDIDPATLENLTGMDLVSGQQNGVLRGLLFSYESNTIASGNVTAVKISGQPEAAITLRKVDLADAFGGRLTIEPKAAEATLPTNFALHQNYPNPFNPTTRIQFELAAATRVTLTVYNIIGQEVIRLADGDYPAGSHSVMWDGHDAQGGAVASGVYLYRIAAGPDSACRRMVLVK